MIYYAYSAQEALLTNALSAVVINSYIKTNALKYVLQNYTTRIPQIVYVCLAISYVYNAQVQIAIIAQNAPVGNTLI